MMGANIACRGFLVSACVLMLVASASMADEIADRKIAAKLVDFQEDKKKLKESTLKNFDKAIDLWKSNRSLTPTARQDKIEQWKRARDHFALIEEFVDDEQFTAIEFDYHIKINRYYAPVAALFHQRIEEALKADDHKTADKVQIEKVRTEHRLLGPMEFAGNSAWYGTFDRSGATIPYYLKIFSINKGGSFTGHVEDYPGIQGNWSYDLEGQINGRVFEYVMTKSVRGRFTKLVAVGVVSGDRLMIRINQNVGKSPPQTGFAILKKRK